MISLIDVAKGKMCGNSDNSAPISLTSRTIFENSALGALIVKSTIPLVSEILALPRTFPMSGFFIESSVSENLLIATTSVLMLASLWVISLTSGWTSSANA